METGPGHLDADRLASIERVLTRTPPPEWVTPSRLLLVGFVAICLIFGCSFLLFKPIYVTLVTGGLVGLVLLFHFPFLGVLAYLVFEYASIQMMYPVLLPFHVGRILVGSTAVMFLLRSIGLRQLRLVREPVLLLLMLWPIWAALSAMVAANRSAALGSTWVLATWVVVVTLIVYQLDSPSKMKWSLWALLLLNLKLSQFQLRSWAAGYDAVGEIYKSRFIQEGMGAGSLSFFANATDFGAAMCIVIPLALYLVGLSRWRPLRLVAFIALCSFTLSLLASGSRGAAVALMAVGLVLWIKRGFSLPVAAGVMAMLATMWVIAPSAYEDRFRSMLKPGADGTASQRLQQWESGLRMMGAHPITGVGIGSFRYAVGDAGGLERLDPHNIFIQAGAELGLPGLAIVTMVLIIAFVRNRETRRLSIDDDEDSRFRRGLADALDLSLVAYIVSGFFVTILYYPHLFVLLALILSLNQIARSAGHADGMARVK